MRFHMNPLSTIVRDAMGRFTTYFFSSSWTSLAQCCRLSEGKIIKNAKFIQAYGCRMEQMTQHCNRLCWTMESIHVDFIIGLHDWWSFIYWWQAKKRERKRRCWCQEIKRLDKSKTISQWMKKVSGHGDGWHDCMLLYSCISFCLRQKVYVCICGCQKQHFIQMNVFQIYARFITSLSFDLQSSQLFIAISSALSPIV